MGKERSITIRVEEQLFRRFTALVALNGTTIAAVLRAYMEPKRMPICLPPRRGLTERGQRNEGAVGSAALGLSDCLRG